jgi:hypothetical protein
VAAVVVALGVLVGQALLTARMVLVATVVAALLGQTGLHTPVAAGVLLEAEVSATNLHFVVRGVLAVAETAGHDLLPVADALIKPLPLLHLERQTAAAVVAGQLTALGLVKAALAL